MKKWNIDKALNKFKEIFIDSDEYSEFLSESDTRSKLIDTLLVDVLGWEEINITREEHVKDNGTFLDYKLSTITPHIIIEAKKKSYEFNLPSSSNQKEYKIGGVLSSSKPLLSAMKQARDYANSKGITFCLVTNGKQYVFFRSHNTQGIDWVDHIAIIFRDYQDVYDNFDLFCRLLSKISVESGKLSKELSISDDVQYESDRFKTLDTSHLVRPRTKDRNSLFPYFGEIIHRVFQDLGAESSESEILENCYVDSPKKDDKHMPYLDRDAKLLQVSKTRAGDFQKRITASLNANKTEDTEVILLIGSVGVGKSTFIQRFRKVLLKDDIEQCGIWLYFNFLKFSDTGESLNDFVYGQIDDSISTDYKKYKIDEWDFIKQAYHHEYEKLKRGTLAPLYNKNPDDFDISFSEHIQKMMAENKEQHYIKLLKTASRRLNKSIFLIFDNADQLRPDTQNDIFLLAQKLSESIKCYSLISLREESYWKNRDTGPLNAFHTTAYHVQPPKLEQVLAKRFQYSKKLITNENFDVITDKKIEKNHLLGIFDRLIKTILGEDKRYIEFIESLSSRDNRRALDTIAYFMISGHTNVDAILRDVKKQTSKQMGITIPFHEFLTAIILRDHETFNEELCDVINVFNVDGISDASNFNRVAVLGCILKSHANKTEVGNGYILIDQVINDCNEAGISEETTISILSLLNSRRLIETETQIKDSITSSKYVRATISGQYYIEKLAHDFGYIDIILLATPIGDQKVFKKINRLNGEINALQSSESATRLKRVEKRLERAETFIEYLHTEFQKSSIRKHKNIFDERCINLLPRVRHNFIREKKEILDRARKIFS